MELPRFRNKAVGDAENLTLCDWLARRGCIIYALVQPRIEALEGLVGVLGFPGLLVVIGQVRGQDPRIVRIKLAQELERGRSGLSCEGVIEGQEVGAVKLRQWLIADFNVDVTTFVVLSTLFGLLVE